MSEKISQSLVLQVLLVAIVGAAAYSGTLDSDFQRDDIPLLVNNPVIRDMSYILDPGSASGFSEYGNFLRRYVGFATFALDYRLHGLDRAGYHIFNTALHIFNALILYAFIVLIAGTPRLKGSSFDKHSGRIALAASLVFVAHPLNTEAVTYIYQRVTALAFLFYVSSLCLYSVARTRGRSWKAAALIMLSVLCAVLAARSKENALSLPLAVCLYELVFFDAPLRERLCMLAPFALAPLAYLSAMHETGLSVSTVLMGLSPDSEGVRKIVERSAFDAYYLDLPSRRKTYFLTELRAIVTYLRLLVLPIGQSADYERAYPEYSSFLSIPVILSAVLHLSLLLFGAWCIRRSKAGARKEMAAVGFGIWFFYIALSVESGIVPQPLYLSEYRAYLPSAGFLVAVLAAAVMAMEKVRSPRKKAYATAAAVVIVLALFSATYARNMVWKTHISLWSDIAEKAPLNSRAFYTLGTYYCEAGEYARAVESLEKGLALKLASGDDTRESYNNLSIAYMQMGMNDSAIDVLTEGIEVEPRAASLRYQLALAYRSKGMWKEAAAGFRQALALEPGHYMSAMGLAGAYVRLHEKDKAAGLYMRALEIRPGDPDAGALLHKLQAGQSSPGAERRAGQVP